MPHKDLQPSDLCVLWDDREKTPWTLDPLRMERARLPVADYTVRGLEKFIAIERKNLNDMVSCVAQNRERFEREIELLRAYETRAIIVEGSWEDLESGAYRSKVSPASAFGSALGWVVSGVPVLMAGDRERAQKIAGRLLFIAARRRFRELQAFQGSLRLADSETPASGT